MKTIAVVGAGGVGAETLLRLAKTRHRVRVIDRDFIDSDTLTRQTLYLKADFGGLKAEVAAQKLGPRFVGIAEHLAPDNADALLQGADAVLDCTDNWATRALINQWALMHRKPWVFTSAIRHETMTTTVRPGKTPCFICWNRQAKAPRSCRVEGITRQTTALAADTQIAELEALLQGRARLGGKLQYSDTQSRTCVVLPLKKDRECPACVKRTFRLPESAAMTLCGTDEYLFQLDTLVSKKALSSLKPKAVGQVLRIPWKNGELAVLPSGRVLTRGLTKTQAMQAMEMLRQKIA